MTDFEKTVATFVCNMNSSTEKQEFSSTGSGITAEVAQETAAENVELHVVMEQYQLSLMRYVSQLTWPDTETCQDVVQETFLRLHHCLQDRGREPITKVGHWLYRVAHNLAMDMLRRKRRVTNLQTRLLVDPVVNPESVYSPETPVQALVRDELQTLAVGAMHQLPDEQRQVVLLKIMEGLTLREISEITGMKIGTVNYRLTQALATMAAELRKKGAI